MNYQDNKRVQTAEELRKIFNLDNLKSDRKAIANNKNGLTKIESEQENILKSIIINLGDTLESQSDISLWFFNGIPSLDKLPTINWEQENYENYTGDIYYDKDTGYVYIFSLVNGSYEWIRSEDTALIQSMALTNSSIDSYDNLRKVFFTTPITPYDCGDWYIKDGNLYICQISKDIDEYYNENDFIIASKYTDDTKANKVAGELTIVSGQVTTIIQNLDVISQTIEDNRYYVDEEGNKLLISTATSQLQQSVKALQSMFQVTGGNNLIKDSQGLLGDDVWEYSEGGTYSSGYDANLIGKITSVANLSIKNGKQTSKAGNITGLVIGNQYTLSFKVSNDDNTTSNIKLFGNSTVYEENFQSKIEMEERIFSFIAETSNYTLEIESNTELDGAIYIYDLMLNKGDIIPWEPAAGEIVGTVLKLSQMGLSIYCTGSEIATLMTSQGFQIRRFANGNLYEVVTEFTKDGFISKKGQLEELVVSNFDFKQITYQGYETLVLYKKESD